MENKDKINIDDLLNQQLQNHESNDFPSFDLFKNKIEVENSNNINFDDFLQEKLDITEDVKDKKWKKFIFLFWFRKVKTSAIVLLIIGMIGYGLNSFLKESNDTKILQSENKSMTNTHKKNELIKEQIVTTQPSEIKENLTLKNNKKINKFKPFQSLIVKEQFEELNNENQVGSIADEPMFFIKNNIRKLDLKPLALEIENAIVSKLKNNTKNQKKSLSVLPSGNYIIGLSFIGSQQRYISTIEEANDNKLNRNYKDISSNGNKSSNVFNYGLSIERTFYKGFGASLGINKTTLLKTQQVNYELKEVPVIDINGEIAGYIQITPDKIQNKVQSKIQYISIPVQLSYSLQIKEKNSIQFKFGTSIMSELSHNNQKYDYTTLQLNPYENDSKKQSFNNLQLGMNYNRNLTQNLILGIGYERQSIRNINSLSDKTEKVKSQINNIGISIKIQL